jgi:protein SCO1/2
VRRSAPIAIALLVAILTGASGDAGLHAAGDADLRAAGDSDLRSGVFDPPREAPDFDLAGSDGAELRLSYYRGKVVVLWFGFTSCPKVCPTTMATLARAREQLGADARDVQVVYVTVDPDRDDVARLRKYLGAFDASFIGGTGTPETLADVRRVYGVEAKLARDPREGYAHSSFTYLIDRAGRLRALMPYGRSADDYVHDIRILLAEGAAADAAP